MFYQQTTSGVWTVFFFTHYKKTSILEFPTTESFNSLNDICWASLSLCESWHLISNLNWEKSFTGANYQNQNLQTETSVTEKCCCGSWLRWCSFSNVNDSETGEKQTCWGSLIPDCVERFSYDTNGGFNIPEFGQMALTAGHWESCHQR